ncbi:hypothetical protein LguiA_002025 [Lonicera macranthoides]
MNWTLISLQHNLILFEKQLPFFVLRKLYDLLDENSHVQSVDLAVLFFLGIFPVKGCKGLISEDFRYTYIHLFDLVHDE